MRHLLAGAFVLLVACDRGSGPPDPTAARTQEPSAAPITSVWFDFEGIQYRAPRDTSMNVSDGVLPGPGGLGGIPAGERIEASIASRHGFYVQLVRTRLPPTLDAMKHALQANHLDRDLRATVTPTGWEVSYEHVDSTGTAQGRAHVLYTMLDGKHYECAWAEVNCRDPAAAEALCRSLRPKP